MKDYSYRNDTFVLHLDMPCPGPAIQMGVKCVEVIPNLFNQAQAETDCKRRGGNLVSIHTRFEQDFVRSYFTSRTDARNAWIGKGVSLWKETLVKAEERKTIC